MNTPNELTNKQVNNGAREIISKTSQLTQVLREFDKLYNDKLASCDGLTVEKWMSAMGVERFTVTKKDGKVQKKGYTPGTIRKGWHSAMQTEGEKGKMCIFKNVPAKYKDENGEKFDVYTIEEAEKLDGKRVTRFMLSEIADDKWTVALILRGLKQGRDFAKYNDKSADSELEWAGLDNLCIVRIVEKDGKQVREIVSIEKSEVYF